MRSCWLAMVLLFLTGCGTFPVDTDGDGLDDGAERQLGTDPSATDTDDDGLTDGEEFVAGTDPLLFDTDRDGLGDGHEIAIGFNPLSPNGDLDALDDSNELLYGTDPRDPDTDGDGLLDHDEVWVYRSDPLTSDTDGDGLLDGVDPYPLDPLNNDDDQDEVLNNDDECPNTLSGVEVDDDGCAPGQLDSDGDGFSDDEEINGIPGTDPFDPTDNPNNVRDTDGDGCSDFDELNFKGSCDNDPNTPDGTGGFDISEVLAATWQVLAASPLDPSAGMIATAFAIDENRLATNAHVVYGTANVLRAGGLGAVVQHETGADLEIVNMWAHPDYDGNSVTSPDVGVIEVNGRLPSWLPLADEAVVRSLRILDDVTLCGFPGDVALLIDFANLQPGDEFRPRASCFTGSISSLRPFDPSAPATPANLQLIQHDIATTGGTSGSAVLDDSGRVIAIHAAATTHEGGTNRFASRSDTLRDLLQLIDSGSLPPLETEASPGGDGTTVFDVTEVLDGDWMLVRDDGDVSDPLACMEFDRGVLIFYDAICWVDDFGFMPNDLDFRAEVLSDGHSIALSYTITISSTYDEVIVGSFADEDHISVFFTSVERGPNGDEWSFPALLVRHGF